MAEKNYDVVIVGAGIAGAIVVIAEKTRKC
jgi:flavin-dependent dehydrogenase